MNLHEMAQSMVEIDDSKSVLNDLIDRSIKHRCARCHCLIFTGTLGAGTCIEIMCRRCKRMTRFGVNYSE